MARAASTTEGIAVVSRESSVANARAGGGSDSRRGCSRRDCPASCCWPTPGGCCWSTPGQAACRAKSPRGGDRCRPTVEEIVSLRCEAIRWSGGVLTGEHSSGTDRVAEVVGRCCERRRDRWSTSRETSRSWSPTRSIFLVAGACENEPRAADVHTGLPDPGSPRRSMIPRASRSSPAPMGGRLYFSRHPIPCVRDE